MSRTKRGPGSGKRKRETDDSDQPAKKPHKQPQKLNHEERMTVTEYNAEIASESPDELAIRFAKAIQKHQGDLSTIELEDQSVPSKAIRDTSKFAESRSAQHLAQFLNQFADEDELKKSEVEASPHTLIVTAAAARATDLVRGVRKLGSEQNKIAKLFAKHMKLKENLEYVQKTRFGIGVGTPNRVRTFVANGTIKLDKLKRIVIDASYVNMKKNTIFDDSEGFLQLLSLLNVEQLKLQLVSDQTQLLCF